MQRRIHAKGVLATIVLLCCSLSTLVAALQPGMFDYAFKCLADTCICTVTARVADPPINLPNCSMTVSENGMPSRMSFLLADISSYIPLFSSSSSQSNSFLSRFISTTTSIVRSPVETTVIAYLSSQQYKAGDSRVSGFLNFFYSSGITRDSLISNIFNSLPVEGTITIQMDVIIFSPKLNEGGLSIRGEFEISVPEAFTVSIVPKQDFYIDDVLYSSPGWKYRIL